MDYESISCTHESTPFSFGTLTWNNRKPRIKESSSILYGRELNSGCIVSMMHFWIHDLVEYSTCKFSVFPTFLVNLDQEFQSSTLVLLGKEKCVYSVNKKPVITYNM